MPYAPLSRALAACALAVGSAASVCAGTLEWDSRLSGATGSYVYDQVTTELWWNNGLAWLTGPWTARAFIPVVLHDMPLLTFGPGGPVPTGGPGRDSTVALARAKGPHNPVSTDGVVQEWDWGVGDPMLSLSAEPRFGIWSPLFTAGIKVPDVASEGFGTGEWDSWVVAGLGAEMSPTLVLDGTVARAWYGDPPGQDILDNWYGYARLTRDNGLGTSLAAFASAATTTVSGYDGPLTAGLSYERRLDGGSRMGLVLEMGLNDTAADFRGSLRYSVRIAGD